MAEDESQTGGKPSVRARKGAEVHVRRAEKPQRGKKERVAEAQGGKKERVFEAQRADEPDSTAVEPSTVGDGASGEGDKPEPHRTGSFSERLAQGEPERPEAPEKPEKPETRWRKWLAIGIAAAVIVVLGVTAAAFSWNRWARYDDRADLQGIWYAYGTKVPVTFTEDAIVFDENTTYAYELDPDAKTIRYTIGDMEGRGRYWLNADRDALVITDGDDYTKWGTVLEDISHWVRDLFNGTSLPLSDQSIAFSRMAMSDGLLTAEPDPAPEPEPEFEPEPEAEPAADAESQPEEPSDDSGKSEKDAMRELPISDIIIEDDTPRWGEGEEGESEE